jgi:hypothetical protein
MRAMKSALIVGLTLFASGAYAEEAGGQSKLGFYVGAEFGSGKTTALVMSQIGSVDIDKTASAYSVFVGIRPNKYWGAEINYVNLGSPHLDNLDQGTGDIVYRATAKNTAFGGSLIGYLPLVPSKWDVFARAGFSSLTTKTDSNGNYPNGCSGNPCVPIGLASFSESHQKAYFTYGAGTQYRFGQLGVRAEYQSIGITGQHQSAYLLGAFWNF